MPDWGKSGVSVELSVRAASVIAALTHLFHPFDLLFGRNKHSEAEIVSLRLLPCNLLFSSAAAFRLSGGPSKKQKQQQKELWL